jgi:hypothetical protein
LEKKLAGLNEKYRYLRAFDSAKLAAGIVTVLSQIDLARGHTQNSPTNLLRVIERLAIDARVGDIRWMAYMLSTITAESRELVVVPVVARDGTPLIIKRGNESVQKTSKQWQMYEPAREMGRGEGKKYFAAAKVFRHLDGRVEVTEQDGHRFMISAAGALIPNLRGFQNVATLALNVGSNVGGPVSKIYADAPGEAYSYYGRGLVQLTWWTGYLATSVAIGKGVDYLLSPDLLLEFETSYEVMVRGMTAGIGYANRNTLGDYLNDTKTDYLSAREIINGTERASLFEGIAKQFETMLMNARHIQS